MYIQEIPNKAIDNCQIVKSYWMLPEDFKVYVYENTVVNHPIHGFEEKILPTFNHYKGAQGGYVAIYTRNAERGVYGVGGDIYVMGQVRIPGEYADRMFIPAGYKPGDNIDQDPAILAICEEYFPDMKGEMWIGGDTGGWYGNVWKGQLSSWENDWSVKPRYDDDGYPINRDWD